MHHINEKNTTDPLNSIRKNALQDIENNTDVDVLQKIAELLKKPDACNKFRSLLNNPLVKSLI